MSIPCSQKHLAEIEWRFFKEFYLIFYSQRKNNVIKCSNSQFGGSDKLMAQSVKKSSVK